MFPKPEFHPILFEEVYIKDMLGQDVISFLEDNFLNSTLIENSRNDDGRNWKEL